MPAGHADSAWRHAKALRELSGCPGFEFENFQKLGESLGFATRATHQNDQQALGPRSKISPQISALRHVRRQPEVDRKVFWPCYFEFSEIRMSTIEHDIVF